MHLGGTDAGGEEDPAALRLGSKYHWFKMGSAAVYLSSYSRKESLPTLNSSAVLSLTTISIYLLFTMTFSLRPITLSFVAVIFW